MMATEKPTPPPNLSIHARKIWDMVKEVKEMRKSNYCGQDRDVMEQLKELKVEICETYVAWATASAKKDIEGRW